MKTVLLREYKHLNMIFNIQDKLFSDKKGICLNYLKLVKISILTQTFTSLTFVSKKAEQFRVKLKTLVNENYPEVDFNVAFKAPKKIGSFFHFKDRIKKTTSQSLFVCKINCKTCNSEYIGKPNEYSYIE